MLYSFNSSKYNCIVFTNFQRTRLFSQNFSLEFIFQMLLKFRSLDIPVKYTFIKKRLRVSLRMQTRAGPK